MRSADRFYRWVEGILLAFGLVVSTPLLAEASAILPSPSGIGFDWTSVRATETQKGVLLTFRAELTGPNWDFWQNALGVSLKQLFGGFPFVTALEVTVEEGGGQIARSVLHMLPAPGEDEETKSYLFAGFDRLPLGPGLHRLLFTAYGCPQGYPLSGWCDGSSDRVLAEEVRYVDVLPTAASRRASPGEPVAAAAPGPALAEGTLALVDQGPGPRQPPGEAWFGQWVEPVLSVAPPPGACSAQILAAQLRLPGREIPLLPDGNLGANLPGPNPTGEDGRAGFLVDWAWWPPPGPEGSVREGPFPIGADFTLLATYPTGRLGCLGPVRSRLLSGGAAAELWVTGTARWLHTTTTGGSLLLP